MITTLYSRAAPWPLAFTIMIAVTAAACGDDGVTVSASEATGETSGASTTGGAATTTSTTSSTSTTADTTTTDGTSATSTSETASSAASTTADSTTGSTSDASTTDASTSDTTTTGDTDGTTTGEEEGVYLARYFAGGLDRVMIRKAEVQSDRCTTIVVVWPGGGLSNQNDPIVRPTDWGIEHASVSQGAQACLEWAPLDPPTVDDSAGAGAITWSTDEPWMCPPTLDIDVTLDFVAGDPPWVPMNVHLSATGLIVADCL